MKHEAQKHRLWQETRHTNYGKGKARMYTDLDYERDHTLNYELWLWQSKATELIDLDSNKRQQENSKTWIAAKQQQEKSKTRTYSFKYSQSRVMGIRWTHSGQGSERVRRK